jgi:hypothetical protein
MTANRIAHLMAMATRRDPRLTLEPAKRPSELVFQVSQPLQEGTREEHSTSLHFYQTSFTSTRDDYVVALILMSTPAGSDSLFKASIVLPVG